MAPVVQVAPVRGGGSVRVRVWMKVGTAATMRSQMEGQVSWPRGGRRGRRALRPASVPHGGGAARPRVVLAVDRLTGARAEDYAAVAVEVEAAVAVTVVVVAVDHVVQIPGRRGTAGHPLQEGGGEAGPPPGGRKGGGSCRNWVPRPMVARTVQRHGRTTSRGLSAGRGACLFSFSSGRRASWS